jgi:transposase-like protein
MSDSHRLYIKRRTGALTVKSPSPIQRNEKADTITPIRDEKAQVVIHAELEMSTKVNTREIASAYRLTHWTQVMRERQESGQSIKAYCRQVGIGVNTYHYWQRKLRIAACEALTAREEVETTRQSVVPTGWAVCSQKEEDVAVSKTIVIEIGKCRVEATMDTDPELLMKVCRMLASLC